jgi:hypothetical protein
MKTIILRARQRRRSWSERTQPLKIADWGRKWLSYWRRGAGMPDEIGFSQLSAEKAERMGHGALALIHAGYRLGI